MTRKLAKPITDQKEEPVTKFPLHEAMTWSFTTQG